MMPDLFSDILVDKDPGCSKGSSKNEDNLQPADLSKSVQISAAIDSGSSNLPGKNIPVNLGPRNLNINCLKL